MLDMKLFNGETSSPEEEEQKPKKSWWDDAFTNAEAYAKAAYANTRELGMGRDIKDTFDKINNKEYSSREEYDKLIQDLDRLEAERNAYRNMFQENQNVLNQNDSMLKDFTEVGGTAQGIATQAKDTAIGFGTGAAIGSAVPILGTSAGAMAGAKWGNRIGAIHQAINDADMNAIDAWEKVLNEGGTTEQAEQAYKDAFWANMPTEASDIISSMYFGGKLTGTAGNILNRVLGGRLAGTLAKGASKVSRFDLPAKVGTYVAQKTGNALLGQGVGVGLGMFGNGIEERIQEPWQDYATERAVDIQRRQYDPTNKLNKDVRDFSVLGEGGLLDYYTTPEGMETGWKAQKMGMLFGGASGLMTKSQFTELGTAHSDSIQSAKREADWIDKQGLLKDKGNLERYNNVKETMANIYDLSEDEKADLSVEDVARMYHEYYTNLFGQGGNRQEQNAVSQADFLNEITGEETARRGLMGDTATKYIDEFGIRPDNETLVGINDNQQVLSEEQVQEALEQDEEETTGEETENKEGIKAKASKPDFFDDKTSEQAKEEKASSETQSVIQKKKKGIPDKFGNWRKIEENDDFDHDLNNIGAEAKYENTKTGRIAHIKRTKAGYQVTDVTDPKDQGTTRNKKGKKKLLNFLKSSFANQKTKFMSDGTQEQEQVSQALPQEDGVIATKDITKDENGDQWFNGKKIQSNKAVTLHSMQDLHDYYKTHKDLMSKDLYAEISRQMMRFGIGNANNTEIVLDLTNREAGGFGSETTIRTDPNDENSAVAKAIVRLYAGADLATAAHEMAHLGWMNLSDQDRATFTKWAEKTQGEFIAKILGMDYDQNFRSYLIEALTNRESKTSQDLWAKIKREGAVQQTLGILNGQNYGLAVEERFAWEFSNWYAQGYIKGSKPRNIIERILNKACATLQGALNLLSDTNRYLNGENGYNGGDINNIFTNMSTRGIGQQRQTVAPQVELRTEMTQPIQESPYNLGQGVNETFEEGLYNNPQQNLGRNTGTVGAQTYETPQVEERPEQDLSRNTGNVPKMARTEGVTRKPTKYTPSLSREEQAREAARVAEEQANATYERINQPQEETSPVNNYANQEYNDADAEFLNNIIKNTTNPQQNVQQQAQQPQQKKNKQNKQVQEEQSTLQPSSEDEYNKSIIENMKADEKAETARIKQIEKAEAQKKKEAEKAEKERLKKIQQEKKEKQKKKDDLKKNAESKIKSANSELNKENPNLDDVSKQISEVEKAIKEFSDEEYTQRMEQGINTPMSSEDKGAINRLQDGLKKLRDKFNDVKQEEPNKSVEKVDLTSDNQNATMVENQERQEVADSGKTENTRGTENLQGNVGEVQGRGTVRTGDDSRTGEGRVGQNSVEERSEGNGKDISLLKNSKFKSVYNERNEKKTEVKDWRDLSDSDEAKQVFVDALNASKEADMQHGVYVDGKTVEELKDCKVILHKNKMAGFAITPDGNIVGVFSNPKNPIRGILNDMIFIAHMMGGNRMDCFGNFLLRGYRACGFTPVARTTFAEEYYPADNPANNTIRKEKPDVFFLVKDNDNNTAYLNKMNKGEYKNDQIEIDDIPLIDSEDSYGDALGFQGQVLEGIQKKENKNKSTKEVADSLRPKEETVTETQETTEQTKDNQTESQGETTEQVQEEDEIAKRDREEKEYYSKKEFEYNGQKYKYEPYWMEYSRLENGKEIKIERNSVEYFVVDSMRKMDSPFYKNKPKLQDVLDDLESEVYGANNRLKGTTKTELKKDKELQRLQKEKKELQNNKKNLQKTIDGLKDSTDTSSLEKTMSGIDYDIKATDGEIYKYLDEIEEMRKDAKEVKQNAPKAIKILKAMYGNKTTTNKSQTETTEITKTQDSESENITKTQNVETQTKTPVQNKTTKQKTKSKKDLRYTTDNTLRGLLNDTNNVEEYLVNTIQGHDSKWTNGYLKTLENDFNKRVDSLEKAGEIRKEEVPKIKEIYKETIAKVTAKVPQTSTVEQPVATKREPVETKTPTEQVQQASEETKKPKTRTFAGIRNKAVKDFGKNYIAREEALKNPDLSFARAYYDIVTTLEEGEGDWEELPLNQDGELSPSKTKAEFNKALTVLKYGADNGNPECNYWLAELASGEESPNIDMFDTVEEAIEERFEFSEEDIAQMYKVASDGGIKVAKSKLPDIDAQTEVVEQTSPQTETATEEKSSEKEGYKDPKIMKYIPKDKQEAVSFTDIDGDDGSYWVYLKEGWCNGEDRGTGIVHERTLKEVKDKARNITRVEDMPERQEIKEKSREELIEESVERYKKMPRQQVEDSLNALVRAGVPQDFADEIRKKLDNKTKTTPQTETTTETKQTTIDKSDKNYQKAVELVIKYRGFSPTGLRFNLKEEEGIDIGYIKAEQYLVQMEKDGLVKGDGEGSLRTLINNPSTKMQEAGQNAENQTMLTPQVEEELENLFWKLIRKKQFHGMDSRWESGKLDYYRSLSNRRQGKEFNPEFIKGDKAFLNAIKNVNDYIHEKFPQYKNVYRGVDGHWRFEFSDKDAHFINGFEKLSGKTLDTTLDKILKHDNLYKFYSKLKGMPVHLVRNTKMQEIMEDTEHKYYAMYDPDEKAIYINSDMFESNDEVRNSLLHEIQHAIQDIEGFANGTNDNAYNNDYDFSEGEKQAVLTEKRSNMSDEELQQNPRSKTLNPNEKTIIQEQRPVQKVAKSPSTKMQSNGQNNLGYIDKQKDIYSVTFTKSAQQNAENKKKIDFYRKNKSYWRENKDAQTGSITFTRALPYQQHQKTIIYDEINGKKVGKRKKAKWREYYEAFKDHMIKWLFNDKHFLEKAARNVGAIESYMRMMVMKDQGAVAGAAIEDGIVKHNGKNGERTKSLNSIIEAVGEENQTDFLNYCEAWRVLDLEKRNIYQKMTPKDARDEIAKVQRSKNAKLFEQQRQYFVEYNHELLWVLVDGGFITEQQYNNFIKIDPNFIPLAKNMDELEGYVDGFKDSKTMINVAHPMHKIGTSMREVANPFLEMQKRTVEYYVKASRNKAGHIFVHDIAEAIAQNAKGDVVAQNQGMVRKLASRDKNGKPISHDNKQYVFYVWENGEKQYYQVADREIYVALKSFDAEQMGALSKIMNATAGKASRLVRNTATMTPDFGLRNLVRDNMEAFISSEHGFLPLVDSLWGMYQMANDTQWFKEYQRMNGEHLSLNRDGEDVATVEHDIKDNVKFYKTIVPLFKKDLHEFMDKDRSMPARAKSLLKLVALDIVPLQSIYKANKRLNDYLETGTRIGEYRNARMGYKGLKGRLFETSGSTIWTTDMDLSRAKNTEMIAAYKSKDITLNFGQHGVLGKELNRYIPFFNASLQGIYKLGNTLDDMIHAEDARRRQELMFKCALMGAMGMAAALAGQGDDDYDEAPDYEHENFWILPNGIRIPKDQLFGKLIGGTVEKATAQYLKDGDVKKLELVQDILGNFAIDKCVPALVDLGWGTIGNYDSFKKKSVTPEYMADKLGYLQKDLSTSKAGADISETIYKVTDGLFKALGYNSGGVDIGAKKVDFVISKTLSNLGKYATSLWELTGGNEKMTRGAEVEDKGGFAETSKELPYPMNQIVGTFATNRNSFQSISDFYERHRELKKLSSDESIMSKNEKKAWEAYQAAYKKDKQYRDALKAIKLDKSLTGAQKRQKADKIFKQQISMARKLHDWEKKHGLV